MKVSTRRLEEGQKGLRYTVTLNEDDPDAMSVLAKIRRGDVSQSSFKFGIEDPDRDEEWSFDGRHKLPLRVMKRLTLEDVAPVAYPAYPTTTATAARTDATSIALRQRIQARLQIERARTWEPSARPRS
jgi:HK97 family phage prohead protease